MRALLVGFAALLILPRAAGALDVPQDDVIQLRHDNKFLFGKITSVTDKGVELTLKDGSKIVVEYKDMTPGTVYKIKADRIDPTSAQAHWDLAEFCLQNGLYGTASVEFDRAVALDKSFADAARKKKDEIHNEEARNKFEEAKRLGAQKKYEDALKLLKELGEKYRDTPYFEEGQREMAKLAEELRKDNEQRAKDLADKQKKKDEAVAKEKEAAEKAVVTTALEGVEEARAQWTEGLDHETKPNLTKADRAYKNAEAKLLAARVHTEKLAKSNDVAMIKQGRELDAAIDAWLVRTYYRLGRMWAAELNYTEAMLWLNKGLKIAPDDPNLNGVLLTLTQMQMRKRAAGQGY